MRSFVAAVVALVIATTTNAQPVAVPQPPPGFNVTLSAGWQHQVMPNGPIYLAADPPRLDCRCVVSAAPNFLQGTQSAINQRPMTPLEKADWGPLLPFYSNFKFNISDIVLHPSGIAAYRGDMRVIENRTGQRQRALIYILASAGTTYAVACAAPETLWSQHELDIGAFVNSFNVNGIALPKTGANPKPSPDGNKQELESLGKEVGPALEKFLTFQTSPNKR